MATVAILKFLSLNRLLFTFVLNWVFLWFPWQRQAFWNVQASKPLINMPYNISIKFHPSPSTLNFSHFFVATVAILKFLSLKIMCTHIRQNIWKVSSNSEHFKFFVVSMATAAILKIPKVVCTSRVFNKIVLNRLNWNLKRLHDKRGGVFFSHTFKMVHSETF